MPAQTWARPSRTSDLRRTPFPPHSPLLTLVPLPPPPGRISLQVEALPRVLPDGTLIGGQATFFLTYIALVNWILVQVAPCVHEEGSGGSGGMDECGIAATTASARTTTLCFLYPRSSTRSHTHGHTW